MCFSSPKTPDVQQYKSSPTPTTTESKTDSATSIEDRRKKLEKMRFGLASTIKTSTSGTQGKAIDLSSASATGKEKLGQ